MNETLGGRISELLDKNGMTQRELADAVGVTEVSMSRYIKGDRVPKGPIIANIAQLYQFLGDLKKARAMFRKSARLQKLSKEAENDLYRFHNLINDLYGEGCLCILMDDIAGAKKCLDKIEQILKRKDVAGVDGSMIAITFFRAQVAFLTGDKRQFKKRLKEIMELSEDVHQIFDFEQ